MGVRSAGKIADCGVVDSVVVFVAELRFREVRLMFENVADGFCGGDELLLELFSKTSIGGLRRRVVLVVLDVGWVELSRVTLAGERVGDVLVVRDGADEGVAPETGREGVAETEELSFV